ncbi:gastric intrinsic factor [Trichonephila clavata]|uniref:Gastric intrinsic factor n=1 Tax=Trichonephila clavata TaxID=2740835 RepID=A0A8X6FYZ0_TRICU|nr:gastric intrinsic factor [Trichonephila clavata]
MSVAKIKGVLLLWIAFHSVRAALIQGCAALIQGDCPIGKLMCTDRSHCIPRTFVCDGEKHCTDGSDELGCGPCYPRQFLCADRNTCIDSRSVCNGNEDCPDGSDEVKCGTAVADPPPTLAPTSEDWTVGPCYPRQFLCADRNTCIDSRSVCNGNEDCPDGSDEVKCGNKVLNVPGVASARARLISWFKERRKSRSTVDKWGPQLPRVAVALHLANESIFSSENTFGQEIIYELTIQLLHRLSKDKSMSSQELALYIHAMLVACMDPRDFCGENLVQELRKRTEASANYTNPFQILVLCNAGDKMTSRDLERVTAAYDSQHRPFWTDTQALASLALACLSTKSNLVTDERILKDMLQELKKHQFRNGTVDNLKTTALVMQALQIYDSFDKDFDVKSALHSSHCTATPQTEAEALEKALNINGETISVQFSVWFGDKIELARIWRLKIHPNNSVYDVIETVAKIDNRQKVEYNVVDGKPFVTSLGGVEDDPERGTFWFVHLKNLNSDGEPELMEQSPVDLKLKPNQEIILWYKPGPWSSHLRVFNFYKVQLRDSNKLC